jgi:hypothetical protein
MDTGDKEVADSKDKDKANSEMPEERSYGLWLMKNNYEVKAALVANQDTSQLTKGGMS